MKATGRRVWVRPPKVLPHSARDRVLLFLAVLALTAVLFGRGALEPRLGEGTLVEVTGAVHSPGIHLLAHADLVSALASAGRLSEDAARPAPQPLHEGDRVWVGRRSLSVGVMADPLRAARPVDVNTATPASLATLPGVGPSLAAAIAERRDRDGPFYAVEDLATARGVGPSKVEALRPFVTVGDVGPRPLPPPFDLGTATAADFERLPGIGPVLAARIVAWRAAHGPFRRVEDLDRVPGVGPKTVERVKVALKGH